MMFKRSLVPTAMATFALAAAGTAAQAQSNVTLYGIVGVNAVYANNTGGAKYRLEDDRLNPSRIGVKGSEDLGGGTSAIFDLESAISPDNGSSSSTFWNRGAYVGFKNAGLGTLTFGRHWNINDDILGNFFIFGGYAVFSLTGFGYTSDLTNNSAKYVSPTWGGFTVEGLVAAGEGNGPKVYEGGVMYAGPVKAAVTYHQAENPAGLKNKLTSGGVALPIGPITIRGGYSEAKNEYDDYGAAPITAYKAQAYDIGVDYTVGAFGFSVDYVARDLKGSGDDSYFVRLLATYALSKRTSLVANLITMQNDGAADERFYRQTPTTSLPGQSQDVFGVAITHSF